MSVPEDRMLYPLPSTGQSLFVLLFHDIFGSIPHFQKQGSRGSRGSWGSGSLFMFPSGSGSTLWSFDIAIEHGPFMGLI